MPSIVPLVEAWNFTPRSTAPLGSSTVIVPGVALGLNKLAVAGPPLILTVVIYVALLTVPSLTTHETVRLGSAPKLVGFWLLDE